MYYNTGFHDDEIVELAAMVHAVPMVDGKSWPPILGLFKSVVVALTYMRRNRVQCELAETYGVSQSTISRAIAVMTPLLGKVLQKYVQTADELDPSRQYVVDGTLLPCWSWASRPELYSGKHKATGVNVQVARTLEGRPRVDLRPHRRQSPRYALSARVGGSSVTRCRELDGRQRLRRQWHAHANQEAHPS